MINLIDGWLLNLAAAAFPWTVGAAAAQQEALQQLLHLLLLASSSLGLMLGYDLCDLGSSITYSI